MINEILSLSEINVIEVTNDNGIEDKDDFSLYTDGFKAGKQKAMNVIKKGSRLTDTNYVIEQEVRVNNISYLFAVDEKATDGMFYAVAEAKYIPDFGVIQYPSVILYDDYFEAIKIFSECFSVAIDAAQNELKNLPFELSVLTAENVDVSIKEYENKVCVVKPVSLIPEKRHAHNRLVFVKHGNGTRPDARGTACYSKELYKTDKDDTVRWERYDLIGVAKYNTLPDWAKTQINILQKEYVEPIVSYLGGIDDYTENTIVEIGTEKSEKFIKFFGYGYQHDSDEKNPYRFLEYVGFIAPLKEVLEMGISEYENKHQEQFKQYITDCTENECKMFYEHYDNGEMPKVIFEDKVDCDTPDGIYISKRGENK